MHFDFTVSRYTKLLETLIEKGFRFYGVHEFYLYTSGNLHEPKQKNSTKNDRIIILRQDLDQLPYNSLKVAYVQHEMGIQSTFYIRNVPASFNPEVVKKIFELGHEIGYHYEDVSHASKKLSVKGNKKLTEKAVVDEAIKSFKWNLNRLNNLVSVKSICMHGSPWSKWDSRLLWKYYDYREFDVDVEPYFDLDFENMLYLTDTGRRWNGSSFSVRDKAGSGGLGEWIHEKNKNGLASNLLSSNDSSRSEFKIHKGNDPNADSLIYPEPPSEQFSILSQEDELHRPGLFKDWKVVPIHGSLMNMTIPSFAFQNRYNFRSTIRIIQAAREDKLPDRMMMTFHPQRWTNRILPWMGELIWQNIKNVIKYLVIQIRK
jgi:hypothetical protein